MILFIYAHIAPGVLDELKRLTPKDPKGRRKHKFFQRLTEDVGDSMLREYFASVITLMQASTNWTNFYRIMQKALPKQNENRELLLEIQDGEII